MTGARVLLAKFKSASGSIERFAIGEGRPGALFRDLQVCAVRLICAVKLASPAATIARGLAGCSGPRAVPPVWLVVMSVIEMEASGR
jgi:hypothetical protein